MSKVEVLVACINQADDALYKVMNLQTDAILANQAKEFSYREYLQENGRVAKLITTPDRGVGKNRNKALLFASAEYILCADQDMIYEDGYEATVLEAFERCPKADAIVFNLTYLNRFSKGRKAGRRIKKVHIYNSLRYGAARIAIRRTALEKATLSFSHLYGGGAKYSAGEDTLFIRDAFRKGLKIYYYPTAIAKVKQEESTWFKGYTDKFFIDKGVLLANAFPFMKFFLVYYFAYRMRKLSKDYSFRKICKLMKKGFGQFKKM